MTRRPCNPVVDNKFRLSTDPKGGLVAQGRHHYVSCMRALWNLRRNGDQPWLERRAHSVGQTYSPVSNSRPSSFSRSAGETPSRATSGQGLRTRGTSDSGNLAGSTRVSSDTATLPAAVPTDPEWISEAGSSSQEARLDSRSADSNSQRAGVDFRDAARRASDAARRTSNAGSEVRDSHGTIRDSRDRGLTQDLGHAEIPHSCG